MAAGASRWRAAYQEASSGLVTAACRRVEACDDPWSAS
jgi:hypothetical protein